MRTQDPGPALLPQPRRELTCLWQPSTMMSFCWGEVRAKTISVWFCRISSICSEVKSLRSVPWMTQALASLRRDEGTVVKARVRSWGHLIDRGTDHRQGGRGGGLIW